jgi:hypothetical protein
VSKANMYALMVGLKTFIAANLPTYLRLVEAEIGIAITDPADHVMGYREALSADRYPTAFYIAADASPEPSGQGSQWLPLSADLIVAYRHSTPATLEKALLGYADALLDLVGDNVDLGGICDVSQITYIDFFHGAPGAKDIGVVVASITMRSEIRT